MLYRQFLPQVEVVLALLTDGRLGRGPGLALVTYHGYHMVMKKVGVADLKAHLSGHLRAVKKGETLIVVERGTPVARVVPATELRSGIVTRPPIRDLSAVRRMLKALPSLALPISSLTILLEDRKR